MKMYGKATETANAILTAFQSPETLPKALAPIFIHRTDDTPCRKWSFRNQFLTALAGTGDARGFKQWQAVDRHVSKGSKCFHILSPCLKKTKDKATGEDKTALYGFKSTAVFRLEDTEGADLPIDTAAQAFIDGLPLIDVARGWGIKVESFTGQHSRFLGAFSPTHKNIAIGVENVDVFLHELTHAADHKGGPGLKGGQHFRQEVVAEFGSAVLGECLGLGQATDLGGAYEYIERYARAAEKTPVDACMECLDRVCLAVALILHTAEALEGARVAS